MSSAASKATEYVRRREFVNRYKLEHGCAFCGYRKHPAALHFSHRLGETKEFNIGSSLNWKWEAVLLEIDKCDVVCANCHMERTEWLGPGGKN